MKLFKCSFCESLLESFCFYPDNRKHSKKKIQSKCILCITLIYQDETRRRKNNLIRMHRVRFGGNREKVIQRDNAKCVRCGITRDDHKKKFRRDITVNHKDGQGRYSEIKNNALENLETLCLSCHSSYDSNRNWQKLNKSNAM